MSASAQSPLDRATDRELLDPLQDAGASSSPAAFRRAPFSVRLAAVPPNFFAIAFGLAGLALTWRAATPIIAVPGAVADTLLAIAAVVWALLVAGLLLRLVRSPSAVAGELGDPVLSPYMAVPGIAALLLAGGLFAHAEAPARVIALPALALAVALGGWLSGQWIAGTVDVQRLHPGYFLPTVAGGFVGADVMALMGYRTIAWLCFGIGVICWMQLGSTILNRLFLGPPLATALVPTLAIEVAPPAVAGNAYFALHSGPDDIVMYALAGFCALSVVTQLRFLPLFARLPFAATFWAFTFSYTSVTTFALNWIAHAHPGHARLLAWIALTSISVFVLAIAVQTVRAAAAGSLFPGLDPVPQGAG